MINLDEDRDRLDALLAALSDLSGFAVSRIPAVRGRDLPDAACCLLADAEGWKMRKGEIGCFLSHVKAWEAIVARGAGWSLVLEDDVEPVGLGRLREQPMPEPYDFVFVNDRMSPGTRSDPPDRALSILPIDRALEVLTRSGKGVGSDGYMITSAAAERLLAAVSRDLFFGNIDWRLLRYSVGEHTLAAIAGSRVDHVLRTHHNPRRQPDWEVLTAGCTSTPLVRYRLGLKSNISGPER